MIVAPVDCQYQPRLGHVEERINMQPILNSLLQILNGKTPDSAVSAMPTPLSENA